MASLDAVQLVPAPGVGLVEVEVGAVEVLRAPLVALAPDRIVLGRVRRVLLHEEAAERGVGLGGVRRAPSSRDAARLVDARRVVLVDQREEERGRVASRPPQISSLDGRRPRPDGGRGEAWPRPSRRA